MMPKRFLQQRYQQTGYSLLELMLVIAILAMLATFGLSAYQQKMQNFRIEKTALQMQQWLEASLTYYAKNNVWPGAGSLAGTTELIQDGYLPPGSDQQNPFCTTGSACYIVEPDPTAGSQQVRVSAVLNTLANPTQIAQLIANRLPNAIVGSSGSQVWAYAAPVMVGPGGGGTITFLNIQTITTGTPVDTHTYTCPAGQQVNTYYSFSQMWGPNTYSGNRYLFSPLGLGVHTISNNKHVVTVYGYGDKPGQACTFDGTIFSSGCTSSTNSQMLAMTVCEPIPTPVASSQRAVTQVVNYLY